MLKSIFNRLSDICRTKPTCGGPGKPAEYEIRDESSFSVELTPGKHSTPDEQLEIVKTIARLRRGPDR